jgi:hypothetical protein
VTRPTDKTDETFEMFTDNPFRQIHELGGIKDNKGKARMDLLSTKALFAIARVLGFGARKYNPNNWRLGLSWNDTFASLQRHLWAWFDGEDIDPESGESHLGCAGAQLMFLLEYYLTNTGEDDRWKGVPPLTVEKITEALAGSATVEALKKGVK